MDEERPPRIPLADFPELAEEIERLLADPARLALVGAHRKTFQRMLAEGMPAYFRPFTKDDGLARALCRALERRAA